MDIVIDKPVRLAGYALHRMVEQHQNGQPALWADEGKQLRIRPRDAEAPCHEAGKLLGFTVSACVALKKKHKHAYLPLADWRGRKAWLEEQGAKHGFELIGVHVTPKMARIESHDGRRFSIDSTEFVGLLRVTDAGAFANALQNGIGRVGKAFGLNMLIVT
jgi:hypothetical protein